MATLTPDEQSKVDQIIAGIPMDVRKRALKDSVDQRCYFEELKKDYPEAYEAATGAFYDSPLLPRDKAERLKELTDKSNSSYLAVERMAKDVARNLGYDGMVPQAGGLHLDGQAMLQIVGAYDSPPCNAISSLEPLQKVATAPKAKAPQMGA